MKTYIPIRIMLVVLLSMALTSIIKAEFLNLNSTVPLSPCNAFETTNSGAEFTSMELRENPAINSPARDKYEEYKDSFEGKAIGIFSDLMSIFLIMSMLVIFVQWIVCSSRK